MSDCCLTAEGTTARTGGAERRPTRPGDRFYRQAAASASEAGTRPAGSWPASIFSRTLPGTWTPRSAWAVTVTWWSRISNQAAVAVRDLRIVVGEQTGSVFRERAAYRLIAIWRPAGRCN